MCVKSMTCGRARENSTCTCRDLLPCLQQGVGFGIYMYINKYRRLAKINVLIPTALLNGMPCSFILKPRGWVSQIRGKPGGGCG